MIEVQVRGGTFPPGTTCEFRDDQFHFDDAKIYLGDAVEARVIDESKETIASADAGIILCAAAAGAFVGACWSGFTLSSILFGALIGGWLANGSEFPIPGQTTFEMRFSNDRSLVGTVDSSEWTLIEETWHVLASATPSILRPAKALAGTALSPE
jgi:hypothetical protein